MARLEKTIFISYRRKDISWALAVYQYLTGQKYDVFFDFSSIPSGDFEQIIIGNIKARAHFVLILTPTALDRCSEPGDWLRREIETAIDEKRNVIPLFFDGFSFGSSSVSERLTGKLSAIKRYNGLDIPSGYFMEAMERLRGRYLNVPLNAVIHPVSTEVRKVVKEEQVAADKALVQKREDIEELVKPAEEKPVEPKQVQIEKATVSSLLPKEKSKNTKPNLRSYGIGGGILLIAALAIFGINSLIQNIGESETPTPTNREILDELTPTPTRSIYISTVTIPPFTPTSESDIGITMVSPKDDMRLVYIPAGEFTMGSDIGESNEQPVHTVYLDAFWIDQTEVTNAMYANCVQDGGCDVPSDTTYFFDSNYETHPVVYVSRDHAHNYCSWADRRLPNEAEWEKASSWNDIGKEKYIYPWGNEFDGSLLNFCDASCSFEWADKNSDDGYSDTSPVGIYPNGASPYGAYDMAGNVWEWLGSLYKPYPFDPAEESGDSTSSDSAVLHGGSWYSYDGDVRSTARFRGNPAGTGNDIGFRCALSE